MPAQILESLWVQPPREGAHLLQAYADTCHTRALASPGVVANSYPGRPAGQGIRGKSHRNPCDIHGGICDHTFEWDFLYRHAIRLAERKLLLSRDACYAYVMVMNETLLARPWGLWCYFEQSAWDEYIARLDINAIRERPWIRWYMWHATWLQNALLSGALLDASIGLADLVRAKVLLYEPEVGEGDESTSGYAGWNLHVDEWQPEMTAQEPHNRQQMVERMVANGNLDSSWITRPSFASWRAIRVLIFERDEYTCQYCGGTTGPLHCDHVIPRAKGGSDDPENLVTACEACNLSKRAKTPEEWRS